jgi:hypothetical protein
MTTQLNSSGLTFSADSTTQTTAALPATGGSMTGYMKNTGWRVYNSSASIHTYWDTWQLSSNSSGQTRNLFGNAGGYSDVHFHLYLRINTSNYQFNAYSGVVGGYGGQYSQRGANNGNFFDLNYDNYTGDKGRLYLRTNQTLNTSSAFVHVVAYLYNIEPAVIFNGTLE